MVSLAAMVTTHALHHIRLFYAAYFAAMGLILPFFPVFLHRQGFDAGSIGLLVGLLAAAKVIAPPCAGRVLDGRSSRFSRRFVVLAALLGGMLAWMLGWFHDIYLLAMVVFLFGVFWATILPLTDGLSVSVAETALVDYGRLRVWGSIGFILASALGGIWLNDAHMQSFPWIVAMLMGVMALAARGFPLHPAAASTADAGADAVCWRPFLLLLLTGFLMQASHGAYYGFFSLYLADAGYRGWQIGAFWIVGVLAEVLLMWRWGGFLERCNPGRVFVLCLLLAALRWVGTALTLSWWLLVPLQLLHAATFAAFHIAAVTSVGRWMGGSRHASAQGWYSAMGFGLGGTLGIMGSGWVVAQAGFEPAFWLCAAVALLAVPVAWLIMRQERVPLR